MYFISKLTHPWMDSLLTCMVTGIALTNFSHNRTELTRMIQRLDGYVYCAFFTLTGASLELDIMVHAFAIALVLVVSRIIALFIGSYFGGLKAGESIEESKYAGFCYITQAGVTLGLAKEVHLNFPGWGGYFATMIIATVVINQLMGPPLMRWALRKVGNAKRGDSPNAEKVVVVGIHPKHSRVLDSLVMMKWEVIEAEMGFDHDGNLVATNEIPLEKKKSKKAVDIELGTRTNSTFALLDPVIDASDGNNNGSDEDEEEIPLGLDLDSTKEDDGKLNNTSDISTISEGSETNTSDQSGDATNNDADPSNSSNNDVAVGGDTSGKSLKEGEDEQKMELPSASPWESFMSSADSSNMLTSDTALIQKYVSWLLVANEPVNVLVILLEDPNGK